MANGALFVVDVASGELDRLPGAQRVHFPTWLPPDGKEILFRVESANPGIYAIAPDGTSKRRAVSKSHPSNEYDYQGIAVSPDGATIMFTRWSSNGRPRVFALDVASGRRRSSRPRDRRESRGRLLARRRDSWRMRASSRRQRTRSSWPTRTAPGSERTVGPKRPAPGGSDEVDASWAFAPDGTALLVRYGNGRRRARLSLLPLDGSPGTSLGSGGFEFVDVQRLAP